MNNEPEWTGRYTYCWHKCKSKIPIEHNKDTAHQHHDDTWDSPWTQESQRLCPSSLRICGKSSQTFHFHSVLCYVPFICPQKAMPVWWSHLVNASLVPKTARYLVRVDGFLIRFRRVTKFNAFVYADMLIPCWDPVPRAMSLASISPIARIRGGDLKATACQLVWIWAIGAFKVWLPRPQRRCSKAQ